MANYKVINLKITQSLSCRCSLFYIALTAVLIFILQPCQRSKDFDDEIQSRELSNLNKKKLVNHCSSNLESDNKLAEM